MSDSTLNRFLGRGTTAQRTAFVPSAPTPSSGPSQGYLWWDTDLQAEYAYDFGTAAWVAVGGGGSGTVTHTAGALTASAVMVGNGAADSKVLASLGSTTTLLHGNAAGLPTFGAVALGADVSGDLPFANLTQLAGLSVLGVGGSATADVAAITATVDGQVLTRVSSSSLAFQAPAASGALILLEQHTASGSASLDFTTCISSAYDNYVIEVVGIIPSTAADLQIALSTDGGSTWNASSIYDWQGNFGYAGGDGIINGVGVTVLSLRGTTTTLLANGSFNGRFELYGPLSTANFKNIIGSWAVHDNAIGPLLVTWFGTWRSQTAANAFQVKPSTGNLTSGTVRCYGIAK